MANDQKGMVPGVNIETLGTVLREELRNALGHQAEALTAREYASVFESMARKLLQRARLKVPVRQIRAHLRRDIGAPHHSWLEPTDGSPDLTLSDLGPSGEIVEIVVVEPGRE